MFSTFSVKTPFYFGIDFDILFNVTEEQNIQVIERNPLRSRKKSQKQDILPTTAIRTEETHKDMLVEETELPLLSINNEGKQEWTIVGNVNKIRQNQIQNNSIHTITNEENAEPFLKNESFIPDLIDPISIQCGKSVDFLHDKNILHRDIAGNFFFSGQPKKLNNLFLFEKPFSKELLDHA